MITNLWKRKLNILCHREDNSEIIPFCIICCQRGGLCVHKQRSSANREIASKSGANFIFIHSCRKVQSDTQKLSSRFIHWVMMVHNFKLASDFMQSSSLPLFVRSSTSSPQREALGCAYRICGYNNNFMNLRSHVIKVLTREAARDLESREFYAALTNASRLQGDCLSTWL